MKNTVYVILCIGAEIIEYRSLSQQNTEDLVEAITGELLRRSFVASYVSSNGDLVFSKKSETATIQRVVKDIVLPKKE